MSIFNVFTLLGGLAMFLFGMDVMGKALERQAGSKLQSILHKMTSHPLKAFLLGLAVTAVIQSSSATTVMVVGFVNSGIMNLGQAITIIMGSNVGTTVTSWILSLSGLDGEGFLIQLLKPTSFSPILAFIGVILYTFSKDEKKKGIGTILLGFAVLMFGMDTMSGAMKPLKDEVWFTDLFLMFSNPVLGVLMGAVLTAVIQSSSASVGILQALAATGAVRYSAAIPIIMGQNIGTCVTALLSSVGANKNARRTAMVHLYFNVLGVIIFLALFYTINAFFPWSFLEDSANELGIAVVHTMFNLVATAILLPFKKFLEFLAVKTVPENAVPEQMELLDERFLSTPSVAAERSMEIACNMAELARESFLSAIRLRGNWDESAAREIEDAEEQVDRYEDMLGTYLVKLSSYQLNHEDNCTVNTLLHAIGNFERISDHAANLIKTADEINTKKITFSPEATEELKVLELAVCDLLVKTVEAFKDHDLDAAREIEPHEQVIDELVRELKSRHISRMRNGYCPLEYGFVLDDLLTNCERVADHCSNLAVEIIQVSEDKLNAHEYLTALKSGESETSDEFKKNYEKFRGIYQFPKVQ